MIKLIIILGSTASGKSGLAVKLAKKFNGEIVSADSRQVYKYLDIGSAKITKKEMAGIPHYLLDLLPPEKTLNAKQFQKLAIQTIKKIHQKNKLAFLVGGTGFYIDAVAKNLIFPKTKTDQKLRQELSLKTKTELIKILTKLDPARAKVIDKENKKRLIRSIEIAEQLGQVPKLKSGRQIFDCLYLGIKTDSENLKQRIKTRFYHWLKQGFLKEVEALIKRKIPETRFKELGLHYWYAYAYLKGMVSKKEFEQKSLASLYQYAKRQRTWFKRNPKIHWLSSQKQAEILIKNFLN
ncbi:MAG: tRNA (adenosine(37)-N6)-dimethylallyltransferase MiaA [Patescibacteria group bacterium]